VCHRRAGAFWLYPVALDRCTTCGACGKTCPTGAIGAERFLLHTERCLTYHNERTAPFPEWIEPGWHHTAVGCLRCQRVCPVNAGHGPQEAPPERFDAQETAAILAATPSADLPERTRAKMRRCGLDYSAELIARNLRALLAAPPS
jgi:epoxyqueuosine reductase